VSSRGAEGVPFGVAGRAGVVALARPLFSCRCWLESRAELATDRKVLPAPAGRAETWSLGSANPLALLGCSLDSRSMGSVELGISHATRAQRERSLRRPRAPWRRGAWSATEVAVALNAQRNELLGVLRLRGDARGLSETVLEEVVSDAICVVVMMRRPVVCEEHLLGAFWTATRILLRQHHEGRHSLRLGSRSRVGFEAVSALLTPDELGPAEVVALKDRAARAADYVAQLDERERDVVTVMAVREAGIKATARILGIPVKSVKSARRSAEGKLDRVAAIAAAGRMCEYRASAIVAYAGATAQAKDEQLARAHLAACSPCRGSYVTLVREMRGRPFQRDAAAAFLPAPAFALGHHYGLLGKLAGWTAERPGGGSGERIAELLGSAGAVKAAAAGGAVVAATATLASGIHTTLSPHPSSHHRRAHVAAVRHASARRVVANVTIAAPPVSTQTVQATTAVPRAAPLTPREHAELEFSSLRSPHQRESFESTKRAIASTAAVSERKRASSSEGSREPSASESSEGSGASQAAREFGQP
jgi:DNA-binding CsgD family transcriptional regulator